MCQKYVSLFVAMRIKSLITFIFLTFSHIFKFSLQSHYTLFMIS